MMDAQIGRPICEEFTTKTQHLNMLENLLVRPPVSPAPASDLRPVGPSTTTFPPQTLVHNTTLLLARHARRSKERYALANNTRNTRRHSKITETVHLAIGMEARVTNHEQLANGPEYHKWSPGRNC